MRYDTGQALLTIGERICRGDYAVRYYRDKQHRKFYGNFQQLLKALRRAIPGQPKKCGVTISVGSTPFFGKV
ncbi:hypothetical protein GGI1_05490 [Acidithiobacillus sp. GGI-221]|nr:hypothetical protein GGI1_05490 [Acidithiobacillus sp. GGI-221]